MFLCNNQLKETRNSFFCVTPKNQVLHESFLKYLKKYKERLISLAGSDHWGSKLSTNIQCEKKNHSLFKIFQKSAKKSTKETISLAYFGPLKAN